MPTYGCKGPKVDIRDYKVRFEAKAAVSQLPKKFKYKNALPKVKNQGMVSSCVAHATSSILENYQWNQVDLSTNFIYGMDAVVSGYDDPGMYLRDACKIVQEFGDMLERDCDGNDEVPKCTTKAKYALHDNLKAKRAKQYCIDSYYTCETTNDIKYAISTYGPVLGCIYWYGSYEFIDDKPTIKFDTNVEGGYHAIVVYGWDETGWYIQNSWGENFGKKGRCVIPYEYPLVEVKVLVDNYATYKDRFLVQPKKVVKKKVVYKPLNKILNKLKKKKKKKK